MRDPPYAHRVAPAAARGHIETRHTTHLVRCALMCARSLVVVYNCTNSYSLTAVGTQS